MRTNLHPRKFMKKQFLKNNDLQACGEIELAYSDNLTFVK